MRVLMLIDNEYGVGTFWRGYNIARNLTRDFDVNITIVHLSRRRLGRITLKSEGGVALMSVPRTGFLSIPIYSLISIFKDYDLLHVFAAAKASTGFAAMFTKTFSRKKVIVDWDDWWTRGGLFGHSFSGELHRFLEEVNPQLADAIIVVSDLLYKRARALGIPSNKIYKVINGADTSLSIYPRDEALERLHLPRNRFYILYAGLSIHSQEFLVFLKAFRAFVDRYRNAVLIILGNVPSTYLKYVQKLGVEDNVHAPRYVPFNEYLLYLSIADAFLLPADPTVVEAARFPIRLGDYLVAGKPILISDVGEMGRFVRECGCGIVVKPRSPEGWLDGLIKLLEDDGMRLEMGVKAEYCAEKFSWRNLAHQIYNIYKRVLHRVD